MERYVSAVRGPALKQLELAWDDVYTQLIEGDEAEDAKDATVIDIVAMGMLLRETVEVIEKIPYPPLNASLLGRLRAASKEVDRAIGYMPDVTEAKIVPIRKGIPS